MEKNSKYGYSPSCGGTDFNVKTGEPIVTLLAYCPVRNFWGKSHFCFPTEYDVPLSEAEKFTTST